MSSSQYFAEQPGAAHRPGTVHLVLPDMHLTLATDSGVFSPGRLDPGTRLLLDVAPPPPPDGDLLDLGTGYGPLALVLAKRSPGARVWAVDVNKRALELCAGNAAAAGLVNVCCVPAPGAGQHSAGQHSAGQYDSSLPASFRLIWSNPPIRIGKQALHSLLTAWLGRLAPGAAAYLVVQRNLGSDSLQRWLAGAGFDASRYAARAGYRVLEVRR
ncbi:MAG TPA: methyltransferase [Streptosporangiaceae bacterium]|nr:methyltransferase [Streptosporangiaceae bacterium]